MDKVIKYYQETVTRAEKTEDMFVKVEINRESKQPLRYTITVNGVGFGGRPVKVIKQLLDEIVADYAKERS